MRFKLSLFIFTLTLTNWARAKFIPVDINPRNHKLSEVLKQNVETLNLEKLSLTPAELNEIQEFYTADSFPTTLYAEIKAQNILADSEITPKGLKSIFPDKCDTLIDQIATVVRQEVTERMIDGARDIKAACPQWNTLTKGDRKDFYVALVTSMALAESSCNNRINNRRATNGTAYGLWQSRRPMSPTQGARWVVNQIDNQIEKSGLLFWSNSNLNYWAVLNPNIHAHKVKRILKKIPACVIRAATSSDRPQ